jgi:hypothetical protein
LKPFLPLRIDSAAGEGLFGSDIDGIAARDLLSRYDLEFDSPAGRLRLYPQPQHSDTVEIEINPVALLTRLFRRGPQPPAWLPRGLTAKDCFAGHVVSARPPDVAKALATQNGYVDWDEGRDLQIPLVVDGHSVNSTFDSGSDETFMNWAEADVLGLSATSPTVHPFPDDPYHEYFIDSLNVTAGNRTLRSGPAVITDRPFPPAVVKGPVLVLGFDRFRDRVLFLSYSTSMICIGGPRGAS